VKLGAERTLGRLPNAERKRLGSGAVLENLNQGVRVARMTPHLRDRQRTEFSQRYPNENALTELAVRSSLPGRLYGAGCNTYLIIILQLGSWFNTGLCINENAPAGG
jgi:hypothetical protein